MTSAANPLGAHVGEHPGEPNLADPGLVSDPFGGYGAIREHGAVTRGRYFDGTPVWLVTRFDDVLTVLNDRRFANDPLSVPGQETDTTAAYAAEALGLPEQFVPYLLGNLLRKDPPDHTRLRRLVSRAFTVRRVSELRPRVELIAEDLLDRLPDHAEDGVVDLIEHFAYPLPITVICELVGIPEQDRPRWREWGAALVSLRPEPFADAIRAIVEHVHALVLERRAAPTGDLLSGLVRARDEDDRLTDTELVTMVLTLVLAGHETTAHLIGNGVEALLAHPDQRAALQADPGLLPDAVHELMRRCGPVHLTRLRYATEDVELAGTLVRRGDVVQPVLVAANSDPRRYSAPDRLDLSRERGGHGEGHLGFGHGAHYCLGAALARQEGEVAFGSLLRRYPDLSPAVPPEKLARVPVPGSWRLTSLPVRL
ncbi:cytochrome P450 family protein [Actinorugispora endophytica]|uniref:Cytochrome P450 n=1 Tax=Actinorugispora endophytica TaxID=1605990 RepID=A0A4R6UXC4_9ACTN|nr:cytochrome P450 [Actinorugispora endophytica]TDQ52095.1 hypothetical protein EV190_10876 [Actinorugispora endophytica]